VIYNMSNLKVNFIYNSMYQLLIMFIPLLTTPYLSRVLGSGGVGIYSYNFSIANYFVLFIMLGLNNYGNREIAKVKDDKNKLESSFWNIYIMQFFCGVVINIIYIAYCFTIAKNKIIALIMGIYVFSGILDINWFFFGIEKFKLTVIRNTVIKILVTCLIFVLVKTNQDVWKYCLIMSFGILISQIVMWRYLKHEICYVKPTWKEVKRHIVPNLFLFLTVLAISLYKIMDKIMLGILSFDSQVGYYELSEKIIAIPTALITSLGTVMLPRMSNLVAKKENESSLLNKSIILAMFLSSSMCFGIMSVAKEFVPLFYGKGYQTCIYLYLILLPSCVFLTFANVIRTQFLLPHQMDKTYVVSTFLGAGINVFANLLFIPKYGAVGAGIGTLLAEITVCLYQSIAVARNIPVLGYVKETIPFIIAGIGMFFILYPLNMSSNLFLGIIYKVVLGIGLYFIFLTIGLVLFNHAMLKRIIDAIKNKI